jgi:hypothetical protein
MIFKVVVILQNCVGLIRDETDFGSEACVTTLDDGTEEGNLEVEESVDIKQENPEAKTFQPIKTEPEVSIWGLCVRQQQFMLPRSFTATKRVHLKTHFNCPYVCTLHSYSLLDQQMHNIYIDNKFLYRNLTSIVTFAIWK